jgi:putative transposase
MMKSYKYKLFNNKKKSKKLSNDLWQFHLIYNHALALIKRHYKLFGKNPKKNDLQKHLKRLMDRGLRPQWKGLGYSQGIQEVTDRIYKSYDAFFKWAKNNRKSARKSPPKFRPFRKYKSFTLKQAGWKLDEQNEKIKIGKVWYRYNKSRNLEGIPKTIVIKRDSVGDWFISVSCDLGDDFVPQKIAPVTGKSAGFDFGLKSFLVSSDGIGHESNEFLKKNLKFLRKKSRNLSKKKKGSKNRKKARNSLARLHRTIANKRTDAHFQLAAKLLKKYDYLFFEDLNLKGMQKLWGRKISDYGFSDFIKILEFKSIEQRKIFHKIDRFFPSSKLCSNCGTIKKKEELKLSDRTYICDCGHTMDRDLNAAINILREGTSSLGLDLVSLEQAQVKIA